MTGGNIKEPADFFYVKFSLKIKMCLGQKTTEKYYTWWRGYSQNVWLFVCSFQCSRDKFSHLSFNRNVQSSFLFLTLPWSVGFSLWPWLSTCPFKTPRKTDFVQQKPGQFFLLSLHSTLKLPQQFKMGMFYPDLFVVIYNRTVIQQS